MKYQMSLRLCNDKGEKFFGKGVVELLHNIDREGSLNLAAKKMSLAYSKAWKILNRAEAELKFPLVLRQSGGKNGGGMVLTEEGKRFLEKYEFFYEEASKSLETIFQKNFK